MDRMKFFQRIIRSRFVLPIILLLFVVLFLGEGCGKEEENSEEVVDYQVYYLNKDETKVVATDYRTTVDKTEKQIDKMIDLLSEQPKDIGLKAPINDQIQILSYHYSNFMLVINFGDRYYAMEPITEVLTRAAIVRTMTQIEDVNYVVFHVDGQALTDDAGNLVGTMTAGTFVDNAGAEINSYETVKLVLFFANESGDRLISTTRTVDYNTNISLEKLVVEQLVSGPSLSEAYPVINSGTKVINVTTKDGTCYVNFDEAFLEQTKQVTPEVVIYAITNSLVELPKVNKVQILINGETDITFRESIPLKDVFERNLDIVE